MALQRSGGKISYQDLPTLDGAPVLLYQLFYNLISNSVKFAKEGVAPKITIISERDIDGDTTDSARIILSDNGIGFDQNYAD